MNKTEYLNNSPHAQGFIHYLSRLISGAASLDFAYSFHHVKAPADFRERFGLQGTARTLEQLFERYYWNNTYYEANAEGLRRLQHELRTAMGGEPVSSAAVYEAVARIMDWGLGPAAAEANKRWAKEQGDRLPLLLAEGKRALESEAPDYSVFQRVRMNAGYTKVFSLLCDGIIIYDSRVGAALCWLARRYLRECRYADGVPGELAFRWERGRSPQNRNPCGEGFEFDRLNGDPMGWAQVNVQASWLLDAARTVSGAAWCAGEEGLRKLECALFMLGYGLPREPIIEQAPQAVRTRGDTAAPVADVTAAAGNRIPFEYAKGYFDLDELEEWVRSLGRGYVIIGGYNVMLADHPREESLDYWLRTRSTNRNVRQACRAVVDRIVASGRFVLVQGHWPEEAHPRKALVLADPART